MSEVATCTVDDRQIRNVFQALLSFTGNSRPAMEEIGQRYEKSVLDNFAHESDPAGRKWARLSARTLLIRLGKGKRTKKSGYLSKAGARYLQAKMILQEAGHLKAAIHYQATATSVTIGVGGHIPYAAIHQFGGKAGRGRKVTIPARPYLALTEGAEMKLAEKDKRMVLEVLHLRIANVIDGKHF